MVVHQESAIAPLDLSTHALSCIHWRRGDKMLLLFTITCSVPAEILELTLCGLVLVCGCSRCLQISSTKHRDKQTTALTRKPLSPKTFARSLCSGLKLTTWNAGRAATRHRHSQSNDEKQPSSHEDGEDRRSKNDLWRWKATGNEARMFVSWTFRVRNGIHLEENLSSTRSTTTQQQNSNFFLAKLFSLKTHSPE